ncbi:MAG: c-type cytochrome [Cocleimonas sp.]|nr:c-type cytochrome [Cocleimonas sp.]
MKKVLFSFFLIVGSWGSLNIKAADDIIGGMSLKENFELAKKFPMSSPWLLSAQCSACHGTMGTEFNDIIPPLAGMDKQEFIDKMQEYKTKDANDFIVMGIITQPLTDEEIVAMADFFAQQKPEPWSKASIKKDIVVPDWAKMKRGVE